MANARSQLRVPCPATCLNSRVAVGRPPIARPRLSFSHLIVSTRNDFESSMAEICYHEGVELIAHSPLAGGSLTGKYLNEIADQEGGYYRPLVVVLYTHARSQWQAPPFRKPPRPNPKPQSLSVLRIHYLDPPRVTNLL